MAQDEDYVGREQSQVKHYILEKYLQRFAHIIGSWADTITYVDCFSGPWQTKTEDLSDTSFAIALKQLREAQATLLEHRQKQLGIRCLFLEEGRRAYRRLKEYADRQQGVAVETLNATMLDSIPAIMDFIRRGGQKSFALVFIDPTGWSGFDLDLIGPLLRHQPGEVLINFMTYHVRRFVTAKEKRHEIRDSFRRLFGTDEVFTRVSQLDDPQDREDELFTSYANRVRAVGQFEYTCPAVVLHPGVERTYFHLIYATRRLKGVEVFKEAEKKAFDFMEQVRAEAEERKSAAKAGKHSLFAGIEDKPPSQREVMLRERYLDAARKRADELLIGKRQVPFDELWAAAVAYPLVWDADVKEWIGGWKSAKRVRITGLAARQRVPQLGKGHVIELRP